MKRVYIVRHGESEANVAKLHGAGHHPLTERGKSQAAFIAERVSHLPIERVMASTMVRAQETGEVIAQKIGLPLTTSPLFVEVNGPSEYMEKRYDDPAIVKVFDHITESWAPGYRYSDEESFDELKERAAQALTFLAEQKEDHIVVVCHGLFTRVLMAYALFGPELSPRECRRMFLGFKSENTGLTILDYKPEDVDGETLKYPWRIFVWNDHAHLG